MNMKLRGGPRTWCFFLYWSLIIFTAHTAGARTKNLPPEVLNAVVTITGSTGAGTGFICNFHGHPVLATNQHMLEVGSPFSINTSDGSTITPLQFYAADDADLVLVVCKGIPPNIVPLDLASLPDKDIQAGDPLVIPGNSKGDDVITQTPGKLLAIGPQKVEVDNPLYPGNSGSPIYHPATGKVIGVFTEVAFHSFDVLEKLSYRSPNSSIKSQERYFGYRIDSVKRWLPLNWNAFQTTEANLARSEQELNDLANYFSGASDPNFDFPELQSARTDAAAIYNDTRHSQEDRQDAYDQLLTQIATLAKKADNRAHQCVIYFHQKQDLDAIDQTTDAIIQTVETERRTESHSPVQPKAGGL